MAATSRRNDDDGANDDDDDDDDDDDEGKPTSAAPPCACLDSSALASGENGDVMSEDGWTFRLFPDPTRIPSSFVGPGSAIADIGLSVESVSVPSNWTVSSHEESCGVCDPPHYTNVQMPFDVLYPHVPKENPTGVYRLEFSALPQRWVRSETNGTESRRRVVLHLGAVESCFFAYVNGRFVGMGKDSRLPSEFDVTSCIHHASEEGGEGSDIGNNVLAIVALKWSDGSFLEQQDHWRGMGGIHRSVFLYSTPAEAFIEDVFCRGELSYAGRVGTTSVVSDRKGMLRIQARIGRDHKTRIEGKNIYYNEQVECARSKGVTYRMLFQLYGPDDAPVFDEPVDAASDGNELVKDGMHTNVQLQ